MCFVGVNIVVECLRQYEVTRENAARHITDCTRLSEHPGDTVFAALRYSRYKDIYLCTYETLIIYCESVSAACLRPCSLYVETIINETS